MSREVRLHPRVERYLGPVAIAQFIDAGWIVHPPMAVTRDGRYAFRKGMGFWNGNEQMLPWPTTSIELPFGNPPTPKWEGRVVRLGRQTAEQE